MQTAPYYNDRADWSLIPDYMQDGIKLYVMHGVMPGSFLTSVFANDFMGAVGNADDTNIRFITSYATFLYNYTPGNCHGSYDIVSAWIKSGGLVGQQAEQPE